MKDWRLASPSPPPLAISRRAVVRLQMRRAPTLTRPRAYAVLLGFAIGSTAVMPGCSRGAPPDDRKPSAESSTRASASGGQVPARADIDEVQTRVDKWFVEVGWLDERTQADVFKDAPYRVDMFNDDGQGRVAETYWVQRIWIDLDRDGKWDEKWTRKLTRKGPGSIETLREVAPADDERFTMRFVDRDDGKGWQPNP